MYGFLKICICAIVPATVSSASFAQGTARFLYLENCGDRDIGSISVEVKKTEDSDWSKSGRNWVQSPLARNQAACFDLTDMYGDVPDESLARLSIEIEGRDPITCRRTRVDKSATGDLRAFTFLGTPLESDLFYLAEGCHSRGYYHWQPKQLCTGQGERIGDIQCE